MDMSWPYVAGFFDGEGSCGGSAAGDGRKLGAYIAQSGSNGLAVLCEIQKFLHSEGIRSSVFQTNLTGRNKCTKPSYRLAVSGFSGVLQFFRNTIPYLRIKKPWAQDLLRYDKLFPNLSTSPKAHAWRCERQRRGALRGPAWHAIFRGKMGRPKGIGR